MKKKSKENNNPFFCPYLENSYYRGPTFTQDPEVTENLDNFISTQNLSFLLEALRACQGKIIYQCPNNDELEVYEDNAHDIVEKEIDWLKHLIEIRHPDSNEARDWLTRFSSTLIPVGKTGPIPWPVDHDDVLKLLIIYEKIKKELKRSGVISKPRKEKLDNTDLRFKALKHFFQDLTIEINKKVNKCVPPKEELRKWSEISAVSKITVNVMSYIYKYFFPNITMSSSKLEKLLVKARERKKVTK